MPNKDYQSKSKTIKNSLQSGMVGFNEASVPINTAGPKEWKSEPKVIDVSRPDGTKVGLVLSPFSRAKDNVLHIYDNNQEGISYDIPTDGDANILLQSHENGELIPLAAASMSMIDGVPTVTMIQRVKASVAEEDIPESDPNDLFKITAIYDRVPHPKADLLQGENRIKWQEILLDQCSEIAKVEGFDRLRLTSGFASRFLEVGHELTLAVQQYDHLANTLEGWIPFKNQNEKITADKRQELDKVIKRVRDKRLRTEGEIHQKHPTVELPVFWEKEL